MLLLSTDSLKGNGLNRIFGIIKKAGFDGIDLYVDPRDFDTQNAAYVKQLSDESNLPVVSLQTSQTASAKDVLNAVDMAQTLGTKIIVVQPPKRFNFKYTKWLLDEVPKIRQRENISIALENATGETFLGIIPEHALNNLNELKKFKHACLDTSRVAARKEDLIRTFHALKKFIVHVHLSNVKRGKGYALPEEGILPLESFLTKLKQEGYAGSISFKINPKFMQADNEAKILKHLADCKKFYEDFFVKVETLPGVESAKKEE